MMVRVSRKIPKGPAQCCWSHIEPQEIMLYQHPSTTTESSVFPESGLVLHKCLCSLVTRKWDFDGILHKTKQDMFFLIVPIAIQTIAI